MGIHDVARAFVKRFLAPKKNQNLLSGTQCLPSPGYSHVTRCVTYDDQMLAVLGAHDEANYKGKETAVHSDVARKRADPHERRSFRGIYNHPRGPGGARA